MKKWIVIPFFILGLITPHSSIGETINSWTDENGVKNFSNKSKQKKLKFNKNSQQSQRTLYQMVIASVIQQNWEKSVIPDFDPSLEANIFMNIGKTGLANEISFEKKSGNIEFDNLVFKAVTESFPLPELPSGMDYYKVSIAFTPKGLQ
tara:strand:+ start:701 stop:1147 length:447 start_codon:yes stop_codon:yes gene_type:complete